ncbi:MAG: LuxR C-terminal-related transcriptional regulator [Actinomycetota bacterium]|nr:LuxR C-terminal-related transcriptional regulator [Actinomycetota bacterium]
MKPRRAGNPEERWRLLDSLVQSSSDAIFSRTLDGTITSWNPAAERLFGYAADEIVGEGAHLLVPPDTADEFAEVTKRIASGERIWDLETIRWTKDRQRVPVSLQLFPIWDDTGSVSGVGCMARDLLRTAEKQKDYVKLQRLSDREREVLGSLADGRTNKDIADEFGLSEQTVKNYVSRILLKLGVESRTEAAAKFLSFRSFLGPGSC